MSKFISFHLINKLLTLLLFGKPFEVTDKHPKYPEIKELLKRPEAETAEQEHTRADELLKLVQANGVQVVMAEVQKTLGYNDVTIDHGVVSVGGKPLHNTLTTRILELQEAGLPYDSLIHFLVNVQANPSPESIESLFDFLEQGKFGFTEDGCFLGYKGVRWGEINGKRCLVDCHSGKIDMTPGLPPIEMPRDAVDDNRGSACGAGLHIGTLEHARGFGQEMLVVKCNPRHVVSVPLYDKTKLRCHVYESVHLYTEDRADIRALSQPVYAKTTTAEDFTKAEKPATRPDREDLSDLSRDKLIRLCATRGITRSVTEGRVLSKEILLGSLKAGALVFRKMPPAELAALCVRRKLFTSEQAARKAGTPRMLAKLAEK